MSVADTEALVKEFQTVKARYDALYKELVVNKVPGYIDLVGLTCNCGESCGTGTSRVDPRLGMTAYQSARART